MPKMKLTSIFNRCKEAATNDYLQVNEKMIDILFN